MHKIVFADDDAIIRRGFEKTVDWRTNGFEVAAIAADGEEALEQVALHRPDILVTDIEMPFMDGIALTERVRKEYPDTEVILLTAYEEFQYAQKALQNHVFDYIVKPLDPTALLHTVIAAAHAKDARDFKDEQLRQSIPLLKKHFLAELLAGHCDEDSAKSIAAFEMPFLTGQTLVSCVRIAPADRQSGGNDVLQGELLRYAVANIAKELLFGEGEGEIVEDSGPLFTVLAPGIGEGAFRGRAQALQQAVQTHLGAALTIGVSRPAQGYAALAAAAQQAAHALAHGHMHGDASLLFYSETGDLPTETLWQPTAQWREAFVREAALGKPRALELLEEQRQELLEKGYAPLQSVQLALAGAAAQLFKEVGNWSHCEVNADYHHFSEEMAATTTVDAAFALLARQAEQISSALQVADTGSKHTLAAKAKDYVDQHFFRPGLSLAGLAQQLFVSQVYLSLVFKQEIGIGFSDYLFEQRMAAAGELARNTSLKAYEIGERVGYPNANYFSILFKKKYGQSISEYRNGGTK